MNTEDEDKYSFGCKDWEEQQLLYGFNTNDEAIIESESGDFCKLGYHQILISTMKLYPNMTL